MTKIFLIHGSYGNSKNHWFPWLKQELEKLGYAVYAPDFPTPQNQSLVSWQRVFQEYLPLVDENTIFIGHSLGCAFILSILEQLKMKLKACFFVSGFIGLLQNPKFDDINATFVTKEFNWKAIQKHCSHFTLYHSDNDPYVPLEKSQELAALLSGKLTIISRAGHFNAKSGYLQFEALLKDIVSP